jgi:hypothetical protein
MASLVFNKAIIQAPIQVKVLSIEKLNTIEAAKRPETDTIYTVEYNDAFATNVSGFVNQDLRINQNHRPFS